jgi:hypothetical protein
MYKTMYDRDVAAIRAYALQDAHKFRNLVTFVLLTIRQPFHHVEKQIADVRQNGRDSRWLFGSKREGYDYVHAHADVLFAAIREAARMDDVVGAVDVLSSVPGLGVVKASFIAQCIGLEASCLDVHHLERLGLPLDAFKLPKKIGHGTKIAKIKAYLDVCAKHGGARHWWNQWCAFVAGRRGSHLSTADAVSAHHVACVVGS